MRYRWNIVFLNNLVQKQTFFIFCIFVFIRYKGSPLGSVFLDRLYKSQRHGTTFLTAWALNFEGFWPRVHLKILISRVVDRVCKSSAPFLSTGWVQETMSSKNKRGVVFLVISAHPGFGFYDGSLANGFGLHVLTFEWQQASRRQGWSSTLFRWKPSRPFGVVFFFSCSITR